MKRTATMLAAGVIALLTAAGCASSTKMSTNAAGGATSPVIHGALGVVQTPLGSVLTDSHGMTIYRFAPDPVGRSTCVGSCLTYWPAVPAAATAGGSGSVAGMSATIGTVVRPDGSHQLSVDGYPVYTYVGDKSAGATTGQGLNTSGGLWWVLGPSGSEITKAAPSAGTSSSSPRYGGGY